MKKRREVQAPVQFLLLQGHSYLQCDVGVSFETLQKWAPTNLKLARCGMRAFPELVNQMTSSSEETH